MLNLGEIRQGYTDSITDVKRFCDETYDERFKASFDIVRQLQSRMRSAVAPITDAEIEEILTTLPLKLFEVSEALNNLKLEQETIKSEFKDVKHRKVIELSRGDMYDNSGRKMSATEQREWVSKCVSAEMAKHELLISAYNTIIERVEREISISKELIMGAKKIWDGRRATETVNPVSEVVPETPDLPDYSNISKKTYIK